MGFVNPSAPPMPPEEFVQLPLREREMRALVEDWASVAAGDGGTPDDGALPGLTSPVWSAASGRRTSPESRSTRWRARAH